jgi:hypothetical protein
MSLSERIAEAQVTSARASATRQAAIDAERQAERLKQDAEYQQALKEYQQYLEERERLEKELADLEAREREIAELERKEQEKKEQQQLQIKTTSESFQIQIAEKQAKIENINQQLGLLKQQELTASVLEREDKLTKEAQKLQGEIKSLKVQETLAVQRLAFEHKYPGVSPPNYIWQTWEKGQGTTSLITIFEREISADEMERIWNIQSSQITAQSEAVKARDELEKIKRDFETKKEQADAKEKPLKEQLESYKLTEAKGTSREKLLAQPFKDLPNITPESILGTTTKESERAVATFEQTQKEQQELSKQIRGASSAAEAYKIKSEFQINNPYVGTAQELKLDGITTATQGVIIEKKLNIAIPDFFKSIEQQEKETITETTKHVTINLTESLDLSYSLGGEARKAQPAGIPEVLIADGKDGREPTIEEMWLLAKQSLDVAKMDFKPSKTDLEIAKYEKENLDEIIKFEGTEAAKTSGTVTPLIDQKANTFEAGFIGHATELGEILQGKEPIRPTLETLAVSDLASQLKSSIGLEEKRESEALKTLQEKAKTPEGQAWIAGSLVGSAAVFAATVAIPGVAAAKIGSTIGKQTLKEATQLAAKISTKAPDEAFIAARTKEIAATLKAKYPLMPETKRTQIATQLAKPDELKAAEKTLRQSYPQITDAEIKSIMRKTAETVPYEVKLISPKVALITTGTESTEKARVILYQKGGKALVFEPPTERKEILQSILLYGRQTDRTAIEAALRKQFPDMAKTAEGKARLTETINLLSKDLEQGKIIMTEKQARAAQKSSPLIRETKEKITISEKEYKVLTTTDELQYAKTDIGKYKVTEKNVEKLKDTTEYARIGTMKAVNLKEFPQQTLKSIDIEDPYKITGIYERAAKQKQPSSKTKTTTTTQDKTTLTVKGEQIKIKADMGKLEKFAESQSKAIGWTGKPDTVKITTTVAGQSVNLGLPQTTTKQSAELASLAESQSKSFEMAKQGKISIPKSTTSINLGLAGQTMTGTKAAAKTAQTTTTKTTQQAKTVQQQQLKQLEFEISKILPDTKQQDLTRIAEQLIIKGKLDEDQIGKWSLIVTPGQKQGIIERLKIITTQITKTRPDIPRPPRTTTIRTPPRQPINIKLDAKMKKAEPPTKRKKGRLIWRWNVNLTSPGMYLPTKGDLAAGKTKKAISEFERIQRKESKRQVKVQFKQPEKITRRRTKQEKPVLEKSFKEMTERKGKRFRFK